MKRILIFLCVLMTVTVNAQEKRFKYQGEAVLGYTFGLEEDFHYAKIDIINGVRFSRYLYAGAGIGIARNFSDEETYFPIYLDVKGYFPVANNLDLMAGRQRDDGVVVQADAPSDAIIVCRELVGEEIMRGCQNFHFQIFALTDYMHLLGRIDDHSVMLLHMKRTAVVSKEAFPLQAHHVDAPAF